MTTQKKAAKSRRGQARRKDILDGKAQELGFMTWGKLETAVKNDEIILAVVSCDCYVQSLKELPHSPLCATKT